MSDQEQITLKVSPRQIDQFCLELCRGTANVSRKHSALIALEGFIIRHASSDTHTDRFNRIITTIQEYAEETRQMLLKEYTEQLEPALTHRNRQEITRIHQMISRNGFDQLLEQVMEHMPVPEQQKLGHWAAQWCGEARAKAEAASGYPDAANFNAAGIPYTEYQAMNELKRRFNPC